MFKKRKEENKLRTGLWQSRDLMLLGKQYSLRMKKNALQSIAPGKKLTELGSSPGNAHWPATPSSPICPWSVPD